MNPHFYGNSALLLLMYTGMRVGEMPSVWLEGNFICCVSEKTRKGYSQVVRRNPILPMLKKVMHLIDFEATKKMSRFTVRDALKRIYSDKILFLERETVLKNADNAYDRARRRKFYLQNGFSDTALLLKNNKMIV